MSASDFNDFLLDQSISTVDNVELLYLKYLAPGRYAMSVTWDTRYIDYALAWFSGNLLPELPTTVPEPSSLLMLLTSVAFGFAIIGRSKLARLHSTSIILHSSLRSPISCISEIAVHGAVGEFGDYRHAALVVVAADQLDHAVDEFGGEAGLD